MKEISILSKSLIVNELLKLIFKKRNEKINFLDHESARTLSETIVIIDDSVDNLESTILALKQNGNAVILLGKTSEQADATIPKPFLPHDVEEVIETISIPQKSTQIKTNVLDPDEIAHIKALMALDNDSEEEEDLSPLEILSKGESFNLKGKDAKEFFYELKTLKTKDLKTLLKQAKVTVKVTFKASSDE